MYLMLSAPGAVHKLSMKQLKNGKWVDIIAVEVLSGIMYVHSNRVRTQMDGSMRVRKVS